MEHIHLRMSETFIDETNQNNQTFVMWSLVKPADLTEIAAHLSQGRYVVCYLACSFALMLHVYRS